MIILYACSPSERRVSGSSVIPQRCSGFGRTRGSPDTGDPRVRPKPLHRWGMTLLPLTRRSEGLQAYKMIMPPNPPERTVEQRTHEGYEWLYVLSGRIRL